MSRPLTLRALLAPLAALALGVGGAVAPAAAHGHHWHDALEWTPYRTAEVVVDADRSTCGFDVRITPLTDEEEYATLATWPDGSPRAQLFRGALVERYTNLETGESAVRDLGATAVFTYRQDGTPKSLTTLGGPVGATMPPGSRPDTGLYVLDGRGTTVRFATDGSRSFTLGAHGSAEDMCDTLG